MFCSGVRSRFRRLAGDPEPSIRRARGRQHAVGHSTLSSDAYPAMWGKCRIFHLMHVLGYIVIAALTCTFTRRTPGWVDECDAFPMCVDLGIVVPTRIG